MTFPPETSRVPSASNPNERTADLWPLKQTKSALYRIINIPILPECHLTIM